MPGVIVQHWHSVYLVSILHTVTRKDRFDLQFLSSQINCGKKAKILFLPDGLVTSEIYSTKGNSTCSTYILALIFLSCYSMNGKHPPSPPPSPHLLPQVTSNTTATLHLQTALSTKSDYNLKDCTEFDAETCNFSSWKIY